MSNPRSQLTEKLVELSRWLYRDHSHLLDTLTMAVDDCYYRLGTVDLGIDDSGRRVVSVFGLHVANSTIVITWRTTDYGNLEADFFLFP